MVRSKQSRIASRILLLFNIQLIRVSSVTIFFTRNRIKSTSYVTDFPHQRMDIQTVIDVLKWETTFHAEAHFI